MRQRREQKFADLGKVGLLLGARFKAAIAELLPRVAERERVPFVPYASI